MAHRLDLRKPTTDTERLQTLKSGQVLSPAKTICLFEKCSENIKSKEKSETHCCVNEPRTLVVGEAGGFQMKDIFIHYFV
jgi:hypothetical protein